MEMFGSVSVEESSWIGISEVSFSLAGSRDTGGRTDRIGPPTGMNPWISTDFRPYPMRIKGMNVSADGDYEWLYLS
ncbi:hypothetical protein J1614_008547 [Plenodomus biglobosus]|nr:hypothetical protein J1614_008547 [Plenodomus biglobosus]